MSVETLRDLVAQLSASATTLAALGATLHARASGKPMHADLQARTDEVLQAAGAAQALDGVSPAEEAPLLAELRHFWKLDDEFLFQPGREGPMLRGGHEDDASADAMSALPCGANEGGTSHQKGFAAGGVEWREREDHDFETAIDSPTGSPPRMTCAKRARYSGCSVSIHRSHQVK